MKSVLTPLVLIGGFLGSGKTTFLRQLLPLLGEANLRPHLIINDYGEAEIDAAALAQLSATVRAINGSCVCCESQDEFLNLLADEELDPYSVLLVETNGTTDPYEIIEALGLDERAQRYHSPLHLSIIDASRWQKRWWHNELERLQVRSSGFHFLSKIDLVNNVRLDLVKASLHKMNAVAISATPSSITEEIVRLRQDNASSVPSSIKVDQHPHHQHKQEGEADAHRFVSLQFALPQQLTRLQMISWLKALPREVVRAKGFVRLAEDPTHLFSFQKVEDAQEIILLPLSSEFAREPLALLIGPALSPSKLPPFEQA